MNATIDILQHRRSGDRYVARTIALWSDEPQNQDCIGHRIAAMAGPLDNDEIAALRSDPHNWTPDNSFDTQQVDLEIEQGEWNYIEELDGE